MKTLKHTSQNIFAVLTEKTVFVANISTGKIYKQFGLSTFNQASWEEIEPISDEQFEQMKADFVSAEDSKKAEKIERERLAKIIAYEARKEEIVNLWNWRKGRINAFRINTADIPVETFGKNPDCRGSWESVFFGTMEEAQEKFQAKIGSWVPEFDDSRNNVQGEVSLYGCDVDLNERLEITSISDLEDLFEEFNVDPIEDEFFSIEIPEKSIIVEMEERRGSFNREYQYPYAIYTKGQSIGSYSIGYRTANEYSDLWPLQIVFDDINEYVEKYIDDEDAISLLTGYFTFENAIEYGLDESYHHIFDKEEKLSENTINAAIDQTLDMCADFRYTFKEAVEYYKSIFQNGNESVFEPILRKFRDSEISREETYELLINL